MPILGKHVLNVMNTQESQQIVLYQSVLGKMR